SRRPPGHQALHRLRHQRRRIHRRKILRLLLRQIVDWLFPREPHGPRKLAPERSSWTTATHKVPPRRKNPPERSSGPSTALFRDGPARNVNGTTRSPRFSATQKPKPPMTAWQRPTFATTTVPTTAPAWHPPVARALPSASAN